MSVGRARLRIVEAPRRFRYLDDTWSGRLVRRIDPARPAVFFVEETLREPAFEAEAFGQANSRRNPGMRDTVWVTRAARDIGIVLAHELFHVLADLGEHDTDPSNLMYERTSARAAATPDSTTGSANDCARWRRRSGWRSRPIRRLSWFLPLTGIRKALPDRQRNPPRDIVTANHRVHRNVLRIDDVRTLGSLRYALP